MMLDNKINKNKFKGTPCIDSDKYTINSRMNFILENIDTARGQIILDVGCGHGIYLSKLQKLYRSCVGIEYSDYNFGEIAKSNRNLNFIRMSGENMAFKDESIDNIIMIEVLEHLHNDRNVIREINRVLKPGRMVIITAPNKFFPLETHGAKIGSRIISSYGFGIPLLPFLPSLIRNRITNAKVYSPSDIEKLMICNGFELVNMSYLGPNLDNLNRLGPKHISLYDAIRKIFKKLEKTHLRYFLPTIIVCARKCKYIN